jgi:hypothetical protein
MVNLLLRNALARGGRTSVTKLWARRTSVPMALLGLSPEMFALIFIASEVTAF